MPVSVYRQFDTVLTRVENCLRTLGPFSDVWVDGQNVGYAKVNNQWRIVYGTPESFMPLANATVFTRSENAQHVLKLRDAILSNRESVHHKLSNAVTELNKFCDSFEVSVP
jgi:hypothetical protein